MLKQQKTFMQKTEAVERQWHEINAEGQVLGRLATSIAKKLLGKEKATFTPHVDAGDYVVVINAEKVVVTRNKAAGKIYYRHSGFPGGLRQRTFSEMQERNPAEIIRLAVKNMLPKNKLQDKRMTRLKIVVGNEHNYSQVK